MAVSVTHPTPFSETGTPPDAQNAWEAAHTVTGLATVAETGAHSDLSGVGTNTHAQIDTHLASTSNPHSVTATQVGLGNVTNHAQTQAAIVPNTVPSAGQILVGNAGGTAYGVVSMSGGATMASTGAVTLSFTGKTTGDLTEGANLYFTDERAQDAVGTILVDGNTVNFTYNDGTPSITAEVITQMSITSDASGVKLSGDSASPGNSMLYGTNASGVKGWYAQPSPTGGTVDIEDEGAAEGAADTIDFVGDGVSVSFSAGKATVTIPGASSSGPSIGLVLAMRLQPGV